MNRLTRKIKGCYCIDLVTCLPMEYEQINKGNACVEKLGKLEDLEEEIGIDLITLFEALKKGIFVAYDSSFGMANKPKIKIAKDTATGICYRNKKWYIQEDETLIKDYGKTWSLDKKILTKEVFGNEKL